MSGSTAHNTVPMQAEIHHFGFEKAKCLIKTAHFLRENMLDLSGLGLDRVPAEIACLSHLEQLDITKNNIIELPRELGKLLKLRVLSLDYETLSKRYPGIVTADPEETARNILGYFSKQRDQPKLGVPNTIAFDLSRTSLPTEGTYYSAPASGKTGLAPNPEPDESRERAIASTVIETTHREVRISSLGPPDHFVTRDTKVIEHWITDDQLQTLAHSGKDKSFDIALAATGAALGFAQNLLAVLVHAVNGQALELGQLFGAFFFIAAGTTAAWALWSYARSKPDIDAFVEHIRSRGTAKV